MKTMNNAFSDLEDFVFEISSSEQFDTVTKWMESRFTGLPIFHKSVHLKVKRVERIIEDEANKLRIPAAVYRMADPHLKQTLEELIAYVQRNEGVKSFGLLHLSVKLVPQLLQKEFKRQKDHKRKLPAFLMKMGTFIDVPVTLAVTSRKTGDYYESLAIGINGISHYRSTLSLFHMEKEHKYMAHAGLTVAASLDHLNHPVPKIMRATNCKLLPGGFLNGYLQNHLIPEREQIVKALCKYVFQGCKPENKVTAAVQLRPIRQTISVIHQ